MGSLAQDARYALRALRRSPGFTISVLLTLALTIGGNAAIFGLIRGILLRPLPYEDPDRLVFIAELHPQQGPRLASFPTFQDWQRESRSFDGLAFIRGQTVILATPEGPEQVVAGYVSPEFFRVVGSAPALGRGFTADEKRAGGPQVAVISDALWRRRFGSDPAAIGRSVAIDDRSVTIVGVMPRSFGYPTWATIWMPITTLPDADQAVLTARGLHTDSRIIGRLRPGLERPQAEVEMSSVAERLAAAYPAENAGWTKVRMLPITQEIMGDARPRLLILQATVFLVLLIGCANLANLSLARGAARARELAVRTAIGASRGRLIQQLFVESWLLALGGAAAGFVLAGWAQAALRSFAPDVLPRLDEVSLDWTVLGFTLGLALLTATAFGLLPALRASRPDLTADLVEGGREIGGGVRGSRGRSALIVAEVALAMMLLVGAGLLLRSFDRMNAVPLGFQPEHLLTARLVPPDSRYGEPERAVELYQHIQREVAAVAGVEAVALTNHVPLTGASMDTRVEVEGRPSDGSTQNMALFRTVSPEYFQTMRIPLVAGRALAPADFSSSGAAVVINQTFARRYFHDTDPLGRRVTAFKSVQRRSDFGEPLDGVVVGVVGDVHHFSQESEVVPEVYLPYLRNPPRWISLVVRTRLDPRQMIPQLQRVVRSVEPDIPLVGADLFSGFAPVGDYLDQNRAPRVVNTSLVALFATTAVVLAMIGLYGVVSYVVTRRERELGLRIALGAQRRDVLRVVLGRTLILCLLGLALGTMGALLLTRFMAGMLFGVTATDPTTFGIMIAVLAGVTLAAAYLPALRATRVDPMISLRSE
jgi:putative ABC transport system permease protein